VTVVGAAGLDETRVVYGNDGSGCGLRPKARVAAVKLRRLSRPAVYMGMLSIESMLEE